MTETVSNLTTEFPIWYRDVSINADGELRSLRLEGIGLLTEEADRELVEGLVRIVFGIDRQPPSQGVLDRVHQGFKVKDPTFDPGSAAREIQVLAGAVLVNMFGISDRLAHIAALSVTTASIDNIRKPDLPMDLVALAEKALNNQSVEARERPDLSDYQKTLTLKIGDGLNAKAEGEEGDAVDAGDLLILAKEIRTALRNIMTRQTKMVGSLEQFIKVQDEELQVLWWYLGGRSNALNCDFSEVPPPSQPLVFGKELADETYILPGLRTIRPLMARAGLKENSKLTIPDMINGTAIDWMKTLMEDNAPSPVTQPLHFAIARRLEVDDDKSWIDAWAGMTGTKASLKIEALKLGELFYREQLLRQFS